MLVFGFLDVRNRIKILADELSEYACSCTMQDAYTTESYQDGIVNEVHHGVDSLVTTHTSYVDVLVEVLLAVFHRGTCHMTGLNGQMGVLVAAGFPSLGGLRGGSFQLFQFHLRAQSAKDDGSLLALYALYLADAVGTFDAHTVACCQRTVLGIQILAGPGCQLLTGGTLFFALFLLALCLAGLALLHLAQFLGKVLFAHQSAGVVVLHLLTELLQFFAHFAGALFLSLCLLDFADGVLYPAVGLGQQFLSLLLGTIEYLLALALYLLQIGLVALDMSLQRLLVLVDGLALALPVALVADNVLQVFVALDIVAAHNLRGVADDLLRNPG